jgi:hypothetical protein
MLERILRELLSKFAIDYLVLMRKEKSANQRVREELDQILKKSRTKRCGTLKCEGFSNALPNQQ